MKRCDWVNDDQLYQKYHDEEWGVPVHDDHKMFEFLLLESFQAGLSWYTILKKRENFRRAFSNFDFGKIADYDENDVERLMQDPGIIRHRQKIEAAINNAQCFIRIRQEWGDFCSYFWNFTDGQTIHNSWKKMAEVPATTNLSDKISKDLKKRGFKFVGSTTIYAHMQACGMVNDHQTNCFRYQELT
jgi:DNA-3-methyladenine glycosylase I